MTRFVLMSLIGISLLQPGLPATAATTVDLTLADAVERALASDETLAQARLAVAAAQADVGGAAAARLPSLDLAGSWTRNLKNPSFFLPSDLAAGFGGATKVEMGQDHGLAGALNLTWNLWTAGRLSAGVGAAREAVEASRWRSELAADAVRYAATVAYADAVLAAENVAIAREALAASREAERLTIAAFEQGTASRFERLQAQVERTNREAPVIAAQSWSESALLNLKRICGLDPAVEVRLIDPLDGGGAPAPETELLAAMGAASPELKSLDHVIAARRQQLSLAEAGRGPVVRLQGSYALQGEWDDGLLPDSDERATSAAVALAVSLPIFDGFETKSAIERARVDLRMAEVERDRVMRDRELAVRSARLNVVAAQAALAGRDAAVDLAAEAHRLAVVRLENGLATPLERLTAELALTQARVQRVEALHECQVARAALELAVGGIEASEGTEEAKR